MARSYIWHNGGPPLGGPPPYSPGAKGGGPTPFTNAFSSPSVNSLRYNTSQYGSPLFIVYGTQRVTVNIIDGYGFTGTSGGKGGKGLGSSGGKKGGANYSVNVAMAICEGPVSFTGASHGFSGNNRVWANGGVAGTNRVGLNFYVGNTGQAADPVFLSHSPNTPVIGYSGTAYVTGTPMQLGSTPALPSIQFEVCGAGRGTLGTNFPDDASPAFIITDLLTNANYGADFPSANLDSAGSIADFGVYCQANGLAMSLLLDRLQPCARWIEEVCELTVAAPVMMGPLLKIIPYSGWGSTGNGVTWVPNTTAQYALTDSDLLGSSNDDPITLTREDPATKTNWLNYEYMDTGNGYNPAIVPVFDQSLMDLYGIRSEPPRQAHEFTNSGSAQSSARLALQRKAYVRNKDIKFKLGFRHSLLELMDLITLTDPNLGWAGFPVRIVGIDEDENGELTFTAEEFLANTGSVTLAAVQAPTGSFANILASPGNANVPIIFEPPPSLSNGVPQVWLVSTGGAQWGGAQVWISTDGNTYAYADTIFAGGRQGFLTAPFLSHADPDTVDTLSVDLTESAGQLLSGTQADADALTTLCYVDGELVSYETAVLTSAYHYNLDTYLRRGAYGTVIGGHGTGTNFARIGPTDPSVFQFTYPANYAGTTIYVKLLSFNLFGLELQALSDVSPYAYTIIGTSTVDNTDNALILALIAGNNQDWGQVADPITQTADFGTLALAIGNDINFGTVP